MRTAALGLLLCISLTGAAEGSRIDPKNKYPRFQVGVTGIHATIEEGLVVTVESIEPGSPADGKLRKGDVILKAGGRPLEGEDVRIPLGEALGEAEARDGRLVFRVKRSGTEKSVRITVPVLGSYSKTWPLDCVKSKKIIGQTAAFLIQAQQPDGSYKLGGKTDRDGLTGCLASLFLLSTGDDKVLPNVRLHAQQLAESAEVAPNQSCWHLGYQGILLAEYHLRTGDPSVLEGLKAICRQAALAQHAGAWSHGATANPGYVQSGLMNSAGLTVFMALALARECGITESEEAFNRALLFFYRMAGHGSICYGDHRSELFPNTNGRNAMLACTLSLLDEKCYRMSAQHLALIVTDSYYAHEFGHTGGGFNVMWRGMGTVHVPPGKQDSYQRQMDKLAWYYDLCRTPSGGFSMLPSPPSETRYCGLMWGTGAVGLTYTAPLKALRITGAPRRSHSTKTKALPALPWGRAADLDFLRTDFCQGYGKDDVPPHVIYAQLQDKGEATVAFCSKMMRHYSPMVRTWAAQKLGNKPESSSVEAIVAGLNHPDPRVRRAACDGISGYRNWHRPSKLGKIPPDLVSARCVPLIIKALENPDAAWWEIDGALWALGRAEPADIRESMPRVRTYARHEEWYLRESAYWAAVGLGKSITGPEFVFLTDMYTRSRHVFARSSYDAGIRVLLRDEKVALDPVHIAEAVRKLGWTTHSALIAEGYGVAGKHEATHRTMMILKHFDPLVYRLLVDDFVTYLQDWTPDYQHSEWLITGSNWQPGLLKVARDLGREAEPLITAFKKCLERIDKQSKNRAHITCREKLEIAIAEYEKSYGKQR